MGRGVIGYIGRFVARDHRFYIDDLTIGPGPIRGGISDRAIGAMRDSVGRSLRGGDLDVDRDTEIDPDFQLVGMNASNPFALACGCKSRAILGLKLPAASKNAVPKR